MVEGHSIESTQGKSSELFEKTETNIQESLKHVKNKIDETVGLNSSVEKHTSDQTGDEENDQRAQEDMDEDTTKHDDMYGSTTEIDDIYGSTTEIDDVYGSTTEPEDICGHVTEEDELYVGTNEVDDCTEKEKEECRQEDKQLNSSALEIKALIFFSYYSYYFSISLFWIRFN